MARADLHTAFFGGRGFTLYHASGAHGSRPLTPHFHDEYLICAQLAGQEECHVAGRLFSFEPGDVVLMNPQQVHTGNARGSSDVDYISLYVDRRLALGLVEDVTGPRCAPEFTSVRVTGRVELVAAIQALHDLVRSDSAPGRTLDVEAALQHVVNHAFTEFSNLREPLRRSTNRIAHRKIARVVDYIRSLDPRIDPTTLSLDELASVAELSKYHFLRQFAQVVGMTPGAYLRTLRLCHAARELRSSRRSILEIALGAGFADHPSFSRAFARHMGMTPSQYQALGPL
ncbi:AraC family transcriptional regulator [Nannocystis sp. SCPEA4]|uniref:AraC family transcriptional regulator n=1 Tax=Nannocystis sp. SCPEA4 TaxID=2996787 RepID=UPI00226F3867|nr:AraC family transcriptional regulator [Nannocystis sp. SCPEA4]MCY1058182.1 AraC family transcriptional regulator [Nannocystis sp. SCPEA4]